MLTIYLILIRLLYRNRVTFSNSRRPVVQCTLHPYIIVNVYLYLLPCLFLCLGFVLKDY